MRVVVLAVSILLLHSLALAAELTIKVVDPNSAAVPGARVLLLRVDQPRALAVETTSADGRTRFAGIAPGQYQVRVLAQGFAVAESSVTAPGSVDVKVSVAVATETVVVSGTRTPVAAEESATAVSALDGSELRAMQAVDQAEALRFLPGTVVGAAGRWGGLSSVFVRGGDSRYNKVVIDDVVVNDPGGTFDFGVVPMIEIDRLEMMRGAASDLYGSDAMTSVVQSWSREGTTQVPELSFGADGGTFHSAHGYLALAGARGRFDYNLFGDQFNSNGQGVNDKYSNSAQGANLGVRLTPRVSFRLRTRHSNSRTGVPSFWNFNGLALVPPDLDQRARQNNFLSSAQLGVSTSRSLHRFTGFEYHHRRTNVDQIMEPGRFSPGFGGFNFDSPFSVLANINRAGLEYQGEYWERSWARTTFGYRFEDENGFSGDLLSPPISHGLRLNHDVYAQQIVTRGRASLVAGVRFVHNGSFGNRAVPRVAASVLALRGGRTLSGTRLRGSYATGIKEPRLEETFATGAFVVPNPNLRAEENRAFDAGVEQKFAEGKYVVAATYFRNVFRDQIEFATDPLTFVGQYTNINKSLAHGSETEFHARLSSRLSLDSSYTYTATQILAAPLCTPQNFCDPLLAAGRPLLRRPRHAGNMLVNYATRRWGAQLGGSFVGRRTDSDFLGLLPHVDHAAGYSRMDLAGWYALNARVSAYVAINNVLNRDYEESAGYPALRVNVRAGMRFRAGGE